MQDFKPILFILSWIKRLAMLWHLQTRKFGCNRCIYVLNCTLNIAMYDGQYVSPKHVGTEQKQQSFLYIFSQCVYWYYTHKRSLFRCSVWNVWNLSASSFPQKIDQVSGVFDWSKSKRLAGWHICALPDTFYVLLEKIRPPIFGVSTTQSLKFWQKEHKNTWQLFTCFTDWSLVVLSHKFGSLSSHSFFGLFLST